MGTTSLPSMSIGAISLLQVILSHRDRIMKRTSLLLLIGAITCTHKVPNAPVSSDAKGGYAGLVQFAVQEIPWDSLCTVAQRKPCAVIRVDSLIYASRLSIINPDVDSVAEKLSEASVPAKEGGGRIV